MQAKKIDFEGGCQNEIKRGWWSERTSEIKKSGKISGVAFGDDGGGVIRNILSNGGVL